MASPGSSDGRLAVVMITHGRRGEAIHAVEQHLRLPERPRLIVVDNASRDGTADAIEAVDPSIEVIRLDSNVGGAARNVGVRRAGTPYVAFSDDDSWWEPGSLAAAVRALEHHPTVAAVTARSLVGPDAVDDPLNEELARSPLTRRPDLPGPRVLGFLACAVVVRTSAFAAVGGFDERLSIGGEEELLAVDLAAAGWDLVYLDDLIVHHHPSPIRSLDGRRQAGIRNTLWFLWRRRPPASIARRMAHLARTLPRDRATLAGVAGAVRGLPWAIGERDVVPAHVERDLRSLDAPQMRSGARPTTGRTPTARSGSPAATVAAWRR
ncbi:MAG: glycosyltransferase [Thermoleophilaceae bacterium]